MCIGNTIDFILELTDPRQLLEIDNTLIPESTPWSLEETIHLFELANALWKYTPHSGMPHAILTSGIHSDGYIDTLELLSYTPVCDRLALQLAKKIQKVYSDRIDWVIGSDHAAADISQSIARVFKTRHAFTEGSEQLWRRHTIHPGQVVLQIEELITTLKTSKCVRDSIEQSTECPVIFAPVLGTIINRSTLTHFQGAPIVSVIDLTINTYEPALCPLCKEGSEAISKPKMNWERLTGKKR